MSFKFLPLPTLSENHQSKDLGSNPSAVESVFFFHRKICTYSFERLLNDNKLFFLLSKYESVKIYWLSVKFDWFKWLKRGYCKSVKFHWLLQWKLTDSSVIIFFPLIQLVIINWFNSEIYFLTGESVKRQMTDSICKNLTDSDLESRRKLIIMFIFRAL